MKSFFMAAGMDWLVAPGLSSLEDPRLPDLSDLHARSRSWVAHLAARILFHSLLDGDDFMRPFLLAALNRSSLAIDEYEQLRASLPAVLHAKAEAPFRYLSVLTHAERVVTEARRAVDCFATLEKQTLGQDSFHDRPEIVALRNLDNAVKHFDQRMLAQQVKLGSSPETVFVSVWLTNSGLSGFGVDRELKFDELVSILHRLAGIAERVLATQMTPTAAAEPTTTS